MGSLVVVVVALRLKEAGWKVVPLVCSSAVHSEY